MTSLHHTPHPYLGQLTAAEVNDRLSDLDLAIEEVIAGGTVAAASSVLTGTALAGQKNLAVVDGTNFAVGSTVYVGHASGSYESGTVASKATNTLTLADNLTNTYASGTPVVVSPTEIVEARGAFTTLGARLASLSLFVNVLAYDENANDGATDARTAIQAAVDSIASFGGTVYCPPGTYKVSLATPAVGSKRAIALPANVNLVGAGRGATVIQLAAGQADDGHVISIADQSHATRSDYVSIRDLTVDGDGANQTKLHQGIYLGYLRGASCHRVTVRNMRGTSNAPPGETFHFTVTAASEVVFVDCEAIGTAGTQGSGFATNDATNVTFLGCRARAMSEGMGFAIWRSRNIQMDGCIAQLNGSHGFNVEISQDVVLSNCIAGGRAVNASGAEPFTSDQSLGNTGSGVVFNGSTGSISDCIVTYNNTGVSLVESGSTPPQVNVYGGRITDNAIGLTTVGTNTRVPTYCRVDPSCVIADNTTTNVSLQPTPTELGYIGGTATMGQYVGSPTMPATNTDLTNPYPWAVLIAITHVSTDAVIVGGPNNYGNANTVLIRPGQTIKIIYTSTPSWLWFRV